MCKHAHTHTETHTITRHSIAQHRVMHQTLIIIERRQTSPK